MASRQEKISVICMVLGVLLFVIFLQYEPEPADDRGDLIYLASVGLLIGGIISYLKA